GRTPPGAVAPDREGSLRLGEGPRPCGLSLALPGRGGAVPEGAAGGLEGLDRRAEKVPQGGGPDLRCSPAPGRPAPGSGEGGGDRETGESQIGDDSWRCTE